MTLLGLGFFNTRVYFIILIVLGIITIIFGAIVLKEIQVIGKDRISKIESKPEV